MNKENDMKEAIVYKDRSGYWAVECRQTNKKIGRLQDSELAAYKIANSYGYIVT